MKPELAGCNGNKALPHEPIAYVKDAQHPFRCPLCEALDKLDTANHLLGVEMSRASV